MAYELIETIEVGSGGASSIEFTSIPQDGVDLVCKLSLRSSDFDRFVQIFVNNSSSGAYIQLRGDGSSVSSISSSSQVNIGSQTTNTQTSNTFSSWDLHLSNYTSSSDKSGSVDNVQENNASSAEQNITAMKHTSSTGVTSLKFTAGTNFVQYSTASLYKIY